MPLLPKQLTATEVIVARDAAASVITKTLSLLMRGGAACYLEFERAILSTCEVVHTTDRFTGADGKVHFEKQHYQRTNPEDLKGACRACGALLEPDEYRLLRVAYSDPVGFVLTDPFLSAVCPIGQVPPGLARALLSALPQPTMADGAMVLPDLSLSSVLAALAAVFSPEAAADAKAAEFNAESSAEALRCFSTETYPTRRVPGVAFANFIAAELLLLHGNAGVSNAELTAMVSAVEGRLAASAGRIEVAPQPTVQQKLKAAAANTALGRAGLPPREVIDAALENHDPRSSIADYRMTHIDVARPAGKFEYYMDQDRRDEWLRGREERDAAPAYMRHTVGYAGHLPEFRYHFGRAFHVIEENLPALTQPKAPLEPVAADAYGPGRKLRTTQMTEHHFTFS